MVALVVDGGPSVHGERVRRGQEPRAWRDVELRVCEHGDRVETLPGHRHPERHQVGRCRRGKDSVRGQDHGPGLRRGVLATHGVARPSKGLVRQATPGPSVPGRPACPHSGGTSVRRGGCWGRGQLQQRDPQGPDLLQAPRPCLFCSLPGVWPGTGLGLRPPVPCPGPWQVVARPALSGSPCPPAHAAGGLARPGARGSSVFTPQKDLPAEAPLRGRAW